MQRSLVVANSGEVDGDDAMPYNAARSSHSFTSTFGQHSGQRYGNADVSGQLDLRQSSATDGSSSAGGSAVGALPWTANRVVPSTRDFQGGVTDVEAGQKSGAGRGGGAGSGAKGGWQLALQTMQQSFTQSRPPSLTLSTQPSLTQSTQPSFTHPNAAGGQVSFTHPNAAGGQMSFTSRLSSRAASYGNGRPCVNNTNAPWLVMQRVDQQKPRRGMGSGFMRHFSVMGGRNNGAGGSALVDMPAAHALRLAVRIGIASGRLEHGVELGSCAVKYRAKRKHCVFLLGSLSSCF
jgi:hypothetical protein